MEKVNFKIVSDIACEVYIDNTLVSNIMKNQIEVLSLVPGEYWIKCVGAYDSKCYIEEMINISSPIVKRINFKSLIDSNTEWTKDSNFVYNPEKKAYYHRATGKIISNPQCEYEEGGDFFYGSALVKKNGKWGRIDKYGNEITPCEYTDPDLRIKELVPYKYTSIEDFSEGLAIVRSEENLFGFIQDDGKEVIPCVHEWCYSFKDGYAIVRRNKKWFLIDKLGNKTKDLDGFDSISMESNLLPLGLIKVSNARMHGFIDFKGNLIISCIYQDIIPLSKHLLKVKFDGKWGIVSITGRVILPCIYDIIEDLTTGLYKFRASGQYGIIREDGVVISPCKYANIEDFVDGIAKIHVLENIKNRSYKYGYIDKNGVEIIPALYDSIYKFINGRAPIYKDGKWGLIDVSGKEIIPCQYKSLSSFVEGIAIIENSDGKYGAIDSNGDILISCKYDKFHHFNQGIAIVAKDNIWGAIDITENIIIPFQFEYISSLNNDIAIVRNNNKYGLVNSKGEEIIECKYDYIKDFDSGYAKVVMFTKPRHSNCDFESRVGLIDNKGNEIIPCIYDHIGDIDIINSEVFVKHGYVDLKSGIYEYTASKFSIRKVPCLHSKHIIHIKEIKDTWDKYNTSTTYSLISPTGDIIIKNSKNITEHSKNTFIVNINNKEGIADEHGNTIIPCIFDKIHSYKDGVACGSVGTYHRTFKCLQNNNVNITKPILSDFHDGLAKIGAHPDYGKFGYIDIDGNVVIPQIYYRADDFINGLARVAKEANGEIKWGYIDTSGTEVIQCQYDVLDIFCEGYAAMRLGEKSGFIDTKGRVVILPIYDTVLPFKEGYAGVKLNNKWHFIDKNGIKLSYNTYDDVRSFCEGRAYVGIEHDRKYWCYYDEDGGDSGEDIIYKCGFIDITGKEITPITFSNVSDFTDGMAIVERDEKLGIIDLTGTELVPCIIDNINYIGGHFEIQDRESDWDIFNVNNECILLLKYYKILYPTNYDNIFKIRKGDLWGLIQHRKKS